jgi:hypothetical protein
MINLIGSTLWLRAFRFGPMEWVWRSLTYLKLQPMRINSSVPTVRTNQAQAAKTLGAPIFDCYADHPDEVAIFRATMQDVSEA